MTVLVHGLAMELKGTGMVQLLDPETYSHDLLEKDRWLCTNILSYLL